MKLLQHGTVVLLLLFNLPGCAARRYVGVESTHGGPAPDDYYVLVVSRGPATDAEATELAEAVSRKLQATGRHADVAIARPSATPDLNRTLVECRILEIDRYGVIARAARTVMFGVVGDFSHLHLRGPGFAYMWSSRRLRAND